MRCDEVGLSRDRDASLASPDVEELLRGLEEDVVEDLNVSSESLTRCPMCSPYVRSVEDFDEGAEGARGRCLDGPRNPSYSKKSSWAPSICFSFFFFLSEDVVPFPLENISLDLTDLSGYF